MIKYFSDRGSSPEVGFADAIINGQAPDGGLYIPTCLPAFEGHEISSYANLTFAEMATSLCKMWFEDEFDRSVWERAATDAFNFEIVLKQVKKNRLIMELFHGPTLSFKDFGARFLAAMLDETLTERGEKATILTATSGDTGSAVADAFAGKDSVRAYVLYPKGGVSKVQEHQITEKRDGVRAVAVDGTFDDCQALVKAAMSDDDLKVIRPTSANSINVGRLIPQSFYYVYAASRMMNERRSFKFSVPCGNFGNLTAGIISMLQGVSTDFIVATNINNVVPEYLDTGVYRPRPSIKTLSSAMDVGSPSNFIRIRHLFEDDVHAMRDVLYPVSVTDSQTLETIRRVYAEHAYVLDPHGAVAWRAADKWIEVSGDDSTIISLSTAHPAKFSKAVESATGSEPTLPEKLIEDLKKPTASDEIPNDLSDLKNYLLSNRS